MREIVSVLIITGVLSDLLHKPFLSNGDILQGMLIDEKMNAKIEGYFSKFTFVRYKKREVIIRPEDKPRGIFFLKNGFVKMNSIFEDGRELTLNIFKPGSYFPMMLALGGINNSYYFEAMTNLEVYRAPKENILEWVKKEPEVLFELTQRIMVGMDGLLTSMEYLLSGTAYSRVVSAILLLSRRFGEKDHNGKVVIKLPLTHQDIANLSGITRETASLEMEKLKKAGLISYTRSELTILKKSELEEETFIYKESSSTPGAL